MAQLAGFKETGMRKIADRMGYRGPMTGFTEYLNANPDKQQMMNSYVNKAMLMASGGYVRKFQEGGFNLPPGFDEQTYFASNPDVLAAVGRGEFTSGADHFQQFGGGENRFGSVGVPQQFLQPVDQGGTITTNIPGVRADQGISAGAARSYIAANPDLVQDALSQGIDVRPGAAPQSSQQIVDYALQHYLSTGFKEGRPLDIGAEPQPVFDARDTVPTTPEAGTTAPDPDPAPTAGTDARDTVTTAPDPNEGLTPEQIHRRNFYASTPEEQEAINARFPFFTLPEGPTDTGAPAVDNTQPATGTVTETQPDTPPPGSVVGSTYLANRPDVAQAIAGGETFGIDPATLQGLSEEEKNQRLAQAHFNAFGNQEGINPVTGLSNAPSNFDGMPDQVIIDYLDQYPDLRAAFGPNNDPATLAKARAHYADFGRREIAEGGRPRLIQFDLSPAQLEAFRYSNTAYENFTPEELRRTYIAIGGASGATNFDRNAQILNNAELAIYRDNNPDLANMSDFELRQHFIQFGRQEMLQGTRTKIDALIPAESPYAGLTSIQDIAASRLERPVLAGDTRITAQRIAGPDGVVPTGTDIPTVRADASKVGQVAGDQTAQFKTAGTADIATAGTLPVAADGTPGEISTVTTSAFQKAKGAVDTATPITLKGSTLNFTEDAEGNLRILPKAAVREDAQGKTATSVADLDAPDATQFKQTDAEAASRAGITDPERVEAAAKRQNAADFIESIAAQSADPSASATVAGQLSNLLGDFDVSNPPSWAAGAMRAATAEMARRGMGASSIAGQAIVQAAMESALPIAQADASIFAQFEGQSLSNKQQMAVIYAQQRAAFAGQEFDQAFQSRVTNAARISDIADKNFTAEQQVVLENSRAANTLNMQNLTNSQALVLAEATSLSQLDVANLNNRQQAAVQEAQAFLQKDMAELSNDQQTTLFKAQNRIQAILSDTAADNARLQFNASSQNQSDQFFANLSTQTSQFNASQKNAIAQFNAGQENTIDRFNAEIGNQRDQFNAQNRLVIDQANAVWRRAIATADTEAVNRANELNASALLDITETAYNDLWQQYADVIEFAYDAAEGELDRATELAIANIDAETRKAIEKERSSTAAGNAIGNLIGTLGSAVIGKVL